MPLELKPQEEALVAAKKILLPFFDSVVIVGRCSSEKDGKTVDSVRHIAHGPFTDLRGLVEVYRDHLRNNHEDVSSDA